MQCPRCQSENRAGRRFCAECGMPLALPCAACGFVNEPGEKFCGGCGTPLTEQPTAPRQPAPAPTPQAPLSYTPRYLAEKILQSQAALEGERALTGLLRPEPGVLQQGDGRLAQPPLGGDRDRQAVRACRRRRRSSINR